MKVRPRLVCRPAAFSALLLAALAAPAFAQGWQEVRAPEVTPVTGIATPPPGVPRFVSIETSSFDYEEGAGSAWSANEGDSWRRTYSSETPYLRDILHDPSDPKTLLGCGFGVFKSTDSGRTWTQTYFPGNYIDRIARDPNAPHRVYGVGYVVHPGGAMHRSMDGGETWDSTDPAFFSSYTDVTVLPSPTRFGTVLMTAFDGLWRSTDGGASVDLVVGSMELERIASSPHTGVAWAFGATGSSEAKVLRSDDGGLTWSTMDAPASDLTDVLPHPLEADVAWVASRKQGVLKTVDGGVSWAAGTGFPPSANVTSLARSKTNDQRLFAGAEGSDAGVWRSDDGGASWAPSSLGLYTSIPGLQFDGQGRVWGLGLGTPIRAPLVPDLSTLAWETLPYDKGAKSTADSLAIDPSDPQRIAWLHRTPKWNTYDRVVFSDDDGATWENITPPAAKDSGQEVRRLAFDPTGRLYAASQYGHLYRTIDDGQTWDPEEAPWSLLTDFLVDPFDLTRLHALDSSRYYASDDYGDTWTEHEVGSNPPASSLHDLHVSHTSPGELFVLGNDGATRLYRSFDNGLGWVAAGAGLPESDQKSLAVDPHDSQHVVVGTEFDGAFLSVDGGASFVPWNAGLGASTVISVEFDVETPGRVWLSRADGRLFVRDVP